MQVEWKASPGLSDYKETLQQMEERVAGIISGTSPELVWLLEYPPLYTASAKQADLLDRAKFPVFQAGRGGEFTYHGPGQRVAYVLLNLKKRGQEDVKAYVMNLEQWIINTLGQFAITGLRKEGRVGIWVENNHTEAKIAAIGIRLRKWITFHGIAINLNPDLSHFSGIVPCGIAKYGVTSCAALDKNITMQALDAVLKEEFYKIF